MAHLKRYNSKNRRCATLFLDKFAFRDQYGFIKDARQEKVDDFTGINAISASDNEKTDVELDKTNMEISEMLRGLELRKRAYYVNMPNLVYIIGGYLFDPYRKERRAPPNDWKWDTEEKKLEKIPPIPGRGRINFGIAANNGRDGPFSFLAVIETKELCTGKVVVVGGNTILNKPTDSCYVYEENDEQWQMLPSLPNPLCGSAVTLDETDSLYVLGGYDLLSGNVQFRNDFLQLEDLTSKKWKKLKNTFSMKNKPQPVLPRARALLIACGDDVVSPDGGLFACGGYHKSPTGELVPISEILCYDKSKKDWTYLSDIPNLQKVNVFSVDNNVLVISEKVKSEEEDDDLIPISKYDFIQRKWIMLDQKEVQEPPMEKTETDQ